MTDALEHAYAVLVEDEEDHGCRELPESACREVPGNAARLVAGFTVQKLGDRVVDPKTLLAWLLTSLGAPDFSVAMLVPVRESGSLIPQTMLVPVIRRFGRRSRVWASGAVGQAIAVVAMGVAALTLTGLAVGVAVLVTLGFFALSRAVSSIAAKDTIGKTIPRGNRGSVTGIAASVAGAGALAVGAGIAIVGRDAGSNMLAWLVVGAAGLWLLGAAVFTTVEEEPSPGDASDAATSITESLALLRDDTPFRMFVLARTLLLVTALSPPFVVSLSATETGDGIAGLGAFVIATGIAGFVGSPIWGRLADRSARLVMASTAGLGGLVISVFLMLRAAGVMGWWLGPATYLALAVIHAGARMGRKTYVVDLAQGDERTRYVAVSNTVIGVLLLFTGVVGAVAAELGVDWTLAGLAAAGLAGAGVAWTLPEIHQD